MLLDDPSLLTQRPLGILDGLLDVRFGLLVGVVQLFASFFQAVGDLASSFLDASDQERADVPHAGVLVVQHLETVLKT